MPQPEVKRVRVGVQEIKIYPWIRGASVASYVEANATTFEALQELGISKASTSAKVTGGESVHILAAFETSRETKVKISVQASDLGAMKVIFGGDFVLQERVGDDGEIQYFAETADGRAPYICVIGKSTNGDGADKYVFAKCRLDGPVNYNHTKDSPTNFEFEVVCVLDKTYVRQNGQVGGLGETIFAENGEETLRS